jgi:hypothetical protein
MKIAGMTVAVPPRASGRNPEHPVAIFQRREHQALASRPMF